LGGREESGSRDLSGTRAGSCSHETQRIVEYINRVGYRILAQIDNKPPFDFKFSVLRSSSINAFATPGGYIYVHRGLINLTENEAQLASVIAHELGHATERHIADAIEKSKLVNIATLAGILAGLLVKGSPELAGGLMTMSTATGTHLNLKYSREHEEEADRMGMYYLTRAGYDPRAMPDFLRIMKRYEFYSSTIPSYFLTHPGTDERIRYLDSLLQTVYRQSGSTEIVGGFKRIQTILLIISVRDLDANKRRFEEGLKKNPGNVDDLYGLAITEAKLGHLDNALNLFNQANARSPHDPDILGDMGITYFMAMRPAEAIDPLREAVERGSTDPEAYIYLAKTYDALGKTTKAIDTLKLLEQKNWDTKRISTTTSPPYTVNQGTGCHHTTISDYTSKRRTERIVPSFTFVRPVNSLPRKTARQRDRFPNPIPRKGKPKREPPS